MPYGNAPPLHPTQAPCNREGRDMNRYPTIGAASAQEKESAAQAEACNTAPSAPPPPPGLMSSAASNTPSYAPPYAPPYSPPYTPPAHPPYTPAYVPPPTFAPTYIPPPAPAPAVGGPPLKKVGLHIGTQNAHVHDKVRMLRFNFLALGEPIINGGTYVLCLSVCLCDSVWVIRFSPRKDDVIKWQALRYKIQVKTIITSNTNSPCVCCRPC
jgi:hypothetical protein